MTRRLRVGAALSLSGKHARFGKQAKLGLDVWQTFDESAELIVEDDRSDPEVLEQVLVSLAARCDLLLGPYSTGLMRRAGRVAAAMDRLIWNHGGSGDDVEEAHPGHVVSVLTPTSRYAEPFVRHLAENGHRSRLWIAEGKGSFGRQVAEGAEACAREWGIPASRIGSGESLPAHGEWNLLCAGSFDEDVEVIKRAGGPRVVCAVAAGVREFGEAVDDPRGIYGVGQWFPGSGHAELGVSEREFLDAYRERAGALPGYPAVQAAATAIIATHCAAEAGSAECAQLWAVAGALETTTLFGAFAIDPHTGLQVGHRAALTRWEAHGPVAVG
ncbi:amino acid/amide ABC transporter substrate-binding protein (HAAT family) [Nonomuraea polychroma]|uniref:Amino acid/amide ABC transporter substrate-binding protein (HAAT family) n=1 Tax=Nonomuraea polychroma TaxID=46176 RepID=A0A438MI81_9ACTN|nr:ABC transporter substrate-binding protein [Nonomuraea polychroma]RVX45609.1 amino acid/amide ABC transporter substrate-binding protein (HAAT family) [Nonomuraea polychroma]